MKGIALLALAMLLLPALHAQVALPEFSWDKYVGTSQWRVTVTEDDSLCNSGVLVKTKTISITHNLTKAKVGDYGHGETVGIFYGNTLSMPQKDVNDGSGYSTLYSHDIVFTSDCSGFSSTYSWYYHDPDPAYDCTGTTTLSGKDLQSGCPALPNTPEIPSMNGTAAVPDTGLSEAHNELVKDLESRESGNPGNYGQEQKIETLYQGILQSDPKNFWANWDMAELRKRQGRYDEYFYYFNNAADNKNIEKKTSDILKQHEAQDLGLSELPTSSTSVFMQRVSGDMGNANGETMYGAKIPDNTANDKTSLSMAMYRLYNSGSYGLLNKLAYGSD